MNYSQPDLESAVAAIDLIDYQEVDWQRVRRSVYLVHQRLAYHYPGPIEQLQQRLMIVPPQQHGDQRLIDHRLAITSSCADTAYQIDAFGNTQITSSVPFVQHSIEFEAWILVERDIHAGSYALSAQTLCDERYTQPSRLTQPDAALSALAARLSADGVQGMALASRLNTWVYQNMQYAHDVTDIHTTASEALALKRGVCQDYAHIMLALCRLCHLPARYASGHLLGEGGTHAWVEVLLPGEDQTGQALVVPLDPTHGRPVGINYVTVAVGRDYVDVAPTSGTYFAAYSGQLSAYKRVGLTLYEYAGTASRNAL